MATRGAASAHDTRQLPPPASPSLPWPRAASRMVKFAKWSRVMMARRCDRGGALLALRRRLVLRRKFRVLLRYLAARAFVLRSIAHWRSGPLARAWGRWKWTLVAAKFRFFRRWFAWFALRRRRADRFRGMKLIGHCLKLWRRNADACKQEYDWALSGRARAWWRRAMLRRMLLAWRAAAHRSRTWGRVVRTLANHAESCLFGRWVRWTAAQKTAEALLRFLGGHLDQALVRLAFTRLTPPFYAPPTPRSLASPPTPRTPRDDERAAKAKLLERCLSRLTSNIHRNRTRVAVDRWTRWAEWAREEARRAVAPRLYRSCRCVAAHAVRHGCPFRQSSLSTMRASAVQRGGGGEGAGGGAGEGDGHGDEEYASFPASAAARQARKDREARAATEGEERRGEAAAAHALLGSMRRSGEREGEGNGSKVGDNEAAGGAGWQEWAMSMPTGGALVDKRRRKRLFEKFDVNGNGYLSLAEVDKGVRDVLQCDRLFHTKPVLIRAFESAKGCDATSGATYGHEYVGRRRNEQGMKDEREMMCNLAPNRLFVK